jgi:hypothetical protein
MKSKAENPNKTSYSTCCTNVIISGNEFTYYTYCILKAGKALINISDS